MRLQYQSTATKSIADLTLEALTALAEELNHRVQSLHHRLAMLRHAEPPPALVALDMAAVETASNLDRIWFEHHRRRRAYIRAELEGEMARPGVPPGEQVVVVVRQLRPGVRARHVLPMLVYHAQAMLRATEAEVLELVS